MKTSKIQLNFPLLAKASPGPLLVAAVMGLFYLIQIPIVGFIGMIAIGTWIYAGVRFADVVIKNSPSTGKTRNIGQENLVGNRIFGSLQGKKTDNRSTQATPIPQLFNHPSLSLSNIGLNGGVLAGFAYVLYELVSSVSLSIRESGQLIYVGGIFIGLIEAAIIGGCATLARYTLQRSAQFEDGEDAQSGQIATIGENQSKPAFQFKPASFKSDQDLPPVPNSKETSSPAKSQDSKLKIGPGLKAKANSTQPPEPDPKTTPSPKLKIRMKK